MSSIQPTPWDSTVFGIDCFEITRADAKTLSHATETVGHYTVKVDPLADKKLLHQYGFYYTDTLIEPVCDRERWQPVADPLARVDRSATLEELLPMCDHSFLHGRFHRDFNLSPALADARYKQWLGQLHQAGHVLALRHDNELAGFIASNNSNLLLHTIAESHRGRGLARGLWTAAITELFHTGLTSLRSSISAANMPVLNLYVSLGFRFDHPVDVYHRLTR